MQIKQHTAIHLTKQPGWCGNDGIRASVSVRHSRVPVTCAVLCVVIAHDQFNSYERDLGMT